MLRQIRQDENGDPISIIRYISSCNAGLEPPQIDLNQEIWNTLIGAQGFFNSTLNPNQSEDFANILNNRDVNATGILPDDLGNDGLTSVADGLIDAAQTQSYEK